MAGVSNRKVKEVAVRHHTFMWNSLTFLLTTLDGFLLLFFFSKIVSEMFVQGDIYAWSVIKSAYTESDGLD